MAYGARIRIGDIEVKSGGGADANDIEVLSFHWGVSQLGSGADARVQIQEFSFVKRTDAASPALFRQCCTREPVREATFRVFQLHGEPRQCLAYTFTDVQITSVRPGGSSQAHDDFPLEEVSLGFGRCEIAYWSEGADGRVIGEPVRSGGDVGPARTR